MYVYVLFEWCSSNCIRNRYSPKNVDTSLQDRCTERPQQMEPRQALPGYSSHWKKFAGTRPAIENKKRGSNTKKKKEHSMERGLGTLTHSLTTTTTTTMLLLLLLPIGHGG